MKENKQTGRRHVINFGGREEALLPWRLGHVIEANGRETMSGRDDRETSVNKEISTGDYRCDTTKTSTSFSLLPYSRANTPTPPSVTATTVFCSRHFLSKSKRCAARRCHQVNHPPRRTRLFVPLFTIRYSFSSSIQLNQFRFAKFKMPQRWRESILHCEAILL